MAAAVRHATSSTPLEFIFSSKTWRWGAKSR